ncbi:hypothetical protein EQP59_03750 [Ornithobacterium rhinotracheale]|uniref:Uncharacterized protein n=1 Tax=Ornithobacterium rhinotracheale TaxID=28251 RepID=A0A410JQU8_ORNRH|nr:hypothetical protein [Ornithobacterium rhinotracheale]QAR30530.1 hypothetical protein EQP59_03750 [Ornithobacterium rhinotracheale]
MLYKILGKDTIKDEIISHLPRAKRGFQVTIPLEEVVNAIIFKEKTLSWQSVYYHYRKWCKILEKSDRLHGVLLS